MRIKQVSIMVENKEGKLAEATGFLASKNINLRALSIADTQSYGILRIIVDEPERAAALLTEAGYLTKLTEVLSVAVPDRPGGMDKIVRKLSSSGVGIEYAYAFPSSDPETAFMVLRVDDNDKAEAVLAED